MDHSYLVEETAGGFYRLSAKSAKSAITEGDGALFIAPLWGPLENDMARLSQGITFMSLQIQPAALVGERHLVVKDMFTTMDGAWEAGGTIFSLPTWARNSYLKPKGSSDYFDDAGGATHLFARVEDESGRPVATDVRFWTNTGLTVNENTGKKKSGWCNLFMNQDSAFNPENEQGPWSVKPAANAEIVTGLGLPYRWHVSTFVVWQWVSGVTVDPPPSGSEIEKRLAKLEKDVAALTKDAVALRSALRQWAGESWIVS